MTTKLDPKRLKALRMDKIEKQAVFGQWTDDSMPVMSDPGQCRARWLALQHELDALADQVDAIQADATLSDIGKAQRIQTAARATLKGFDRHAEVLPKFRDNRNKVAGAAVVKPTAEAAIIHELRCQEIRRYLSALDPLARQIAIGEAAATGDVDMIAAVRTAPKYMRLLPAEKLVEAETALLDAVMPGKAAELRVVDDSLHVFETSLQNARDIVETAADLKVDPLVQMAEAAE